MSKRKKSDVVRRPFTDDNGEIKFHIRALRGVVIILPDPKWTEDKLGTLVLPECVKARKNVGTVLACGPGIKNTRTKKFEHGVPVGTRVMFEDSVPWEYEATDPATGKVHKLVMCSVVDVAASVEE